jgi:hypothetical protein
VESFLSNEGLLDFNKLLATDDIKLFKKYVNYPVNKHELSVHIVKTSTPREIMSMALNGGFHKLRDAFYADTITSDRKELIGALLADPAYLESFVEEERKWWSNKNQNQLLGEDRYTYHLFSRYGSSHSSRDAVTMSKAIANYDGKKYRCVTFDKIIKNKSPEFFEMACIDDSQKKDWALTKVDPKNFVVLKLLFDHGAKLHRVYTQDDGWGYEEYIDETDEIGTAIRHEELNRLLGGGQKK